MGDYLKISSGLIADANATETSAGAGDAGKIPKLDGAGKLDTTLMPAGVGAETRSNTASENIAAGDLINYHDSSGVKIRKADATSAGKPAQGFVLSAISSAASGTVYPEEAVITGLSGLTIGARYFLSTTAGAITTTAPSSSGQVVQEVGYALSATELLFRPQPPITLA